MCGWTREFHMCLKNQLCLLVRSVLDSREAKRWKVNIGQLFPFFELLWLPLSLLPPLSALWHFLQFSISHVISTSLSPCLLSTSFSSEFGNWNRFQSSQKVVSATRTNFGNRQQVRQACSSHHQVVICVCFWFKLKLNINKYLLLAEDPQEVLEPAYTRKDLIRTPHAHGSSGRLDPSLNKYWEGNTMAGRSAGEVWMRVGLVCFYCSSCTCICTFTVHVCHKV